MRYDTPVFFQRVLPGEYDSKTGNYAADQVTEVQKMASVMDTRAEIMQIVYGGIRRGQRDRTASKSLPEAVGPDPDREHNL